jgi:protein SCO1/2
MRRGNSIVIFSCILVIFAILLVNKQAPPEPINNVTYFNYPTQYDKMFSSNDLVGKITVADFFFTSCPMICPRMNQYMKELNEYYADALDIQFLSISVDPENDTKSVINEYITKQELEYANWFFLESTLESISELLEKGFLLSGDGLPGLHSTKFILINANAEILGYYDPMDDEQFRKLKSDATYLLNRL